MKEKPVWDTMIESYSDKHLADRIKWWEANQQVRNELDQTVLGMLYREQERRVNEQLLAWVEGK